MFFLSACVSQGPQSSADAVLVTDSDSPDSDSPDSDSPDSDSDPTPTYGTSAEYCGEVDAFEPVYPDVIATWNAQDDLGFNPADPLVLVGSSSIKRWEQFTRWYPEYPVIQRGFGGSQLGEVAYYAYELIIRHNPRVIVVFAGTNDISNGVSVDTLTNRFRCLRARVGEGLGFDRPFVYIGVTPSPGRWEAWPDYSDYNARIAALAEVENFTYVDVATPFLATGEPPDASLYVADLLHLSDEGYALWDTVVRPAIDAASDGDAPRGSGPAPGTRLLVDLGPSDLGYGEETPSPDYLGQHWNNMYPRDHDTEAMPGERLFGLVDDAGLATSVNLFFTGGFALSGRQSGDVIWPDQELLGSLAVGSATGDYGLYNEDQFQGGVGVEGLDPNATYSLRVFGGYASAIVTTVPVTVWGASSETQTVQVSGEGSGSGGANDDTLLSFVGVQPDAWGHIFIDLELEEGMFGSLGAIEVIAE